MSAGGLKPFIVPVFIPHMGCPHRCVFCEQKRITSQPVPSLHKAHIEATLRQAVNAQGFDRRRHPEVAFYGGTFTGLPRDVMKGALETVQPYIEKGWFHSIRISTRPDAIDTERLQLLKRYGVSTVELGAQSMNDGVLSRSKRGHLREDTIRAAHLLKGKGFRVGIQLMPGLPGDTREIFASTIETVIGLRPDMVRLYPVVVIRGTELARWYQDGKYSPLPLQEAVDICAEGCSRLEHKGIPVIRIGLMSSPALLERGQILEGPWHPAFGFLVRSRIYRTKIARELTGIGPTHGIKIRAPRTAIPLIRGYRNEGLEWLKGETGARVVAIRTDDDVPDGDVRVEAL